MPVRKMLSVVALAAMTFAGTPGANAQPVSPYSFGPVQGMPYGMFGQSFLPRGADPNTPGSFSYEFTLDAWWVPSGITVSGFATGDGGRMDWIHCICPSRSPVKTCQRFVNGAPAGMTLLPNNGVDVGTLIMGRQRRNSGWGLPAGKMETRGTGTWNGMRVRGKMVYYR